MIYRRAALIASAIAVATSGILVFWTRQSPRTTFERYAGWGLPPDAQDIRVAIRVGPEGDYVFSTFKLSAEDFAVSMEDLQGDPIETYLDRVEALQIPTAPDWWMSNVDVEEHVVWFVPCPICRWPFCSARFVYEAKGSVVHVAVPIHEDCAHSWSPPILDRWLAQLRGLLGL